MCSAKNLSPALAAAGAHGRRDSTGMALPDAAEKVCRCIWPGRRGGTRIQNRWDHSAPDTSMGFLTNGRNGSDGYCEGGVNVFCMEPFFPPMIQPDLETLQELAAPHIVSCNYFASRGLDLVVTGMTCVEIAQPGSSTKLRIWLEWLFILPSDKETTETIQDQRLLYFEHRDNKPRWVWPVDPSFKQLKDSEERPPSVHPNGVNRYESQDRFPVNGLGVEDEIFQIFIKTLSGKAVLVWVSAQDTGDTLKSMIAQREGYSRITFYILYEGKVLNEGDRLKDCQIYKNSTLHVMYRLRGGSVGKRGTAGPSTYKDAARAKGPQSSAAPNSSPPKPYIVEKLDDIPTLEVKNTEVTQLFSNLQTHALICRFNGFWPRSYDLHKWIYSNWTTNCQILLCSKGFFVVQFESEEEYEKIIEQGPWFWGRAGLFLTPWFPYFDANSMVVTKMPVWVRLPNLPLPFWHHLVLEDIGNLLGKYIKRDTDRHEQGLFTYARIRVEIDLSKGLPDKIKLIYEKHKWIQELDYENTAFRCRFCHLTGHLQDLCPLAKRHPKKNQGKKTKGKTWQAEYDPPTDEDSEGEESEPEEKQEEEVNEENVHTANTVESQQSDSKDAGKETLTENMQLMATSLTGSKRAHESENSDSDKEKTYVQPREEQASKEMVVVVPQQGGWIEVKSKKREKKGKLEDYYKIPNS